MRGPTIASATLLAAVLLAGSAPAAKDDLNGPSWTTYGNSPSRAGATAAPFDTRNLKSAFFLPVAGRITAQVLAAPAADGSTILFATTSDGRVYAMTRRGYVLWTRDFGQLATACPQLDGYGITGTGAIDTATRTLFVADAFGRLHALDLDSGAERKGWPVRVFADVTREHVWGALLLAEGRVYVPTGSYCDTGPMQGHVYAVDLASRDVRSWAPVPAELGGGGGIWGWGGIAYSAQRHSLYVATGNAFRQGSETAGYGEHVVELSPDLDVRSASTTSEPTAGADADLVGSPVVFARPGCGELVAAIKKDGTLYGWRTDDLAAGPLWRVEIERFDESNPLLAQPAYDPTLDALVLVTGKRIVRVDVAADCTPHVAWSHMLGTTTENGLPTIDGATIWVTLSGKSWTLAAVDAGTGAIRARVPIGGPVLTAPSIVGGELVLGSFAGGVQAFGSAPAGEPRTAATVAGHSSRLTNRLVWTSRSDGVYASADGGVRWRRIYASPAIRVVRTSRNAGLIAVGTPPSPCTCHARILWTTTAGRTWHETDALTAMTAGGGRRLFWLDALGKRLSQVRRWPPLRGLIRSRVAAVATAGRIIELAPVPGGVAALMTARGDGHGWDEAPRVLLDRRGRSTILRLPRVDGSILVRSIAASWPAIMVQ
ncbi:MAG TPA: PQQ-binding-like beta-propeller repeat protein, partial [Gaiellaceae bacterium]|nr:PQQ-binding-like beta-propeller repeat protein [Gaiellaceae bacterium]